MADPGRAQKRKVDDASFYDVPPDKELQHPPKHRGRRDTTKASFQKPKQQVPCKSHCKSSFFRSSANTSRAARHVHALRDPPQPQSPPTSTRRPDRRSRDHSSPVMISSEEGSSPVSAVQQPLQSSSAHKSPAPRTMDESHRSSQPKIASPILGSSPPTTAKLPRANTAKEALQAIRGEERHHQRQQLRSSRAQVHGALGTQNAIESTRPDSLEFQQMLDRIDGIPDGSRIFSPATPEETAFLLRHSPPTAYVQTSSRQGKRNTTPSTGNLRALTHSSVKTNQPGMGEPHSPRPPLRDLHPNEVADPVEQHPHDETQGDSIRSKFESRSSFTRRPFRILDPPGAAPASSLRAPRAPLGNTAYAQNGSSEDRNSDSTTAVGYPRHPQSAPPAALAQVHGVTLDRDLLARARRVTVTYDFDPPADQNL